MKQLCFAHNANKVASKHISLHICGMISLFELYCNNIIQSFIESLNHSFIESFIHSFPSYVIFPLLFSLTPLSLHQFTSCKRESRSLGSLFSHRIHVSFFLPSTHSIESKFSHLPISCIFLPMHPIRFFPSIPPKCT